MLNIFIDPLAKGRVTPSAVLQTEGSIELIGLREKYFSANKAAYFHVTAEGFCFGLGFTGGQLIFQRNNFVLAMPPAFLKKIRGNDSVVASWTMNRLTFLLGHIGFQGPSISKSLDIACCPTPVELFDWARKKSLLPVAQYSTESELLERIHSSLQAVQEKIDRMSSVDIFWDIDYSGNKIVSRTPKKEKDLQPIIQAILSDQMYLSSIEVVPEFQTGSGNVDFMFIGFVDKVGMVKMCAEFKCAHSKDIFDGIRYQLSSYMEAQRTRHGTYCVLDFRCDWFDQPKMSNTEFSSELGYMAKQAGLPKNDLIKIHRFNLGKKTSASRLASQNAG